MRMPSLRRGVITIALLTVPLLAAPEDPGLSGYVLTPDGVPATAGTVMFQLHGADVTASIDPSGRFRVVPHSAGSHQMHVVVPGFAPHRAMVMVPASKTVTLPPIRLSPATYFRVRFVSPAGEPIAAAHVIRQSVDVNGTAIREPAAGYDRDRVEPDGAVIIGPLPRGMTMMAVDAPLLARMRLPDVRVSGESALIDGGTVIVERGARVEVDVVDGAGAPVAGHDVYLDDAVPLSPLMFQPVRTDERGRATFERVGSGHYRAHTRTVDPCGRSLLAIVRTVSVVGAGTIRVRLVVGGTAVVRLTSSDVPLTATQVWVTAEPVAVSAPGWLRGRPETTRLVWRPFGFGSGSPCLGTTDGEGRVTFPNFPPGPARLDVRLPGSTYVRRITVPVQQQDVRVDVPSGYLPIRVLNARTGEPVARAEISWISGGARVEAISSASGEALLGGVAAAGGTLTVTSRGFEPATVKLAEPPAVLHDVALVPTRDMTLECRVVTASGEPMADAVVELTPENPLEIAHIAPTDVKGVARFFGPPPGALALLARADGYVASGVRIPADATSDAVVTLSRGYRAIVRVESSKGGGAELIRILNEEGALMDDFLDAASARSIEPPGTASLGPLPPGAYVVELRGAPTARRQRFRIEKADVHLTFGLPDGDSARGPRATMGAPSEER